MNEALGALRTAVNSLDVPVDGDILVELLAMRDALEARVTAAVSEFDRSGMWELEGCSNMTAWLKGHARMTANEAYRLVHTARRLMTLPATAKAWSSGELSGGQVATVLATLRREHRELYATQEEELVPKLAALDIDQTRRALGYWTANAEALIDPDFRAEPERSFRASRLLGDRVVLEGELDADSGEVVLTALRVAETPDTKGEPPRTPGARRADALADICRFFLANQTGRPGGRHRPHVNVIVEADDLYEARRARYESGAPVSDSVAAQMLCDSVVHRVVVEPKGAILDYGRATRTISAPLWAALVARDQGCRFPGCNRPTHWSEAHHVVWWEHGGETSSANLVLLCHRHHHLLHRRRWRAKLLPDATFEVTDDLGRVRSASPPRELIASLPDPPG
jgi:hypothetical protein